jgi:hypothetical protein
MEGCRGTTRVIRRRRFTFALVGEARYFDVAELKLPSVSRRHRGRNESESKERCRLGWPETRSGPLSVKACLDIAWSSRVFSRFLNGD